MDPAQWTAIGTVALAAFTAMFVVLTWLMARLARQNAADAANAAASARDAARAAQEGNSLLLAQLPIAFTVSYRLDRSATIGAWATLTVECGASTVFLHELRHVGSTGLAAGGKLAFDFTPKPPTEGERELLSRGIYPTQPCPQVPSDFPRAFPLLMHRGETATFLFPRPPLETSPVQPHIRTRVIYSVTEDGEARSIDCDVVVAPPTPPLDLD
jgi:hypothetical protein